MKPSTQAVAIAKLVVEKLCPAGYDPEEFAQVEVEIDIALRAQLAAYRDELALKDTEIARLGKLLGATVVEPTTAFSEDDYMRTITGLRTQLTAAQSALREAEAARGEDSARLDWLENEKVCYHVSIYRQPDGNHIYHRSPCRGAIRTAIDAARAQEAKS